MNTFQNTIKKLKNRQQWLVFLIFTLVTVLMWSVIGLVTSQKNSGVETELLKLAQPLTPYIDREVITALEKKVVYSQSALNDFPIYRLPENTRLQTKQPQVITTDLETQIGTSSASSSTSPDSSATASASPNLNNSSSATKSADER